MSTVPATAPPDLSPAQLVDMLRMMLRIREFDERALELYREGAMRGTTHPYIAATGTAWPKAETRAS
jgi:TPP-dependent pyruvate/acetoin dehydrogenase alpha subunit